MPEVQLLANEAEKDTNIKIRYGGLKSKGISILDVPNDTVPRLFLDSILKSCGTSFKYFFDEFVLDYTKNLLHERILIERCAGDTQQYQRVCLAFLTNTEDRRTLNATLKELRMLEHCKSKGISRVPFLGMNSRKKAIKNTIDSPIRVFITVGDKLELRVASALLGIPLWQYIGELFTEGMLRIFVRDCTTPEERALLLGDIYEDVPNDLLTECIELIYERIIHEYNASMRSVYGIDEPHMRSGFDIVGLNRIVGRATLTLVDTPPEVNVGVSHGIIDVPDISKKKISIIKDDSKDKFEGVLLSSDIRAIMESNIHRMSGETLPMDAPIANPMIKHSLERFRDIVTQRYVTKETRVADIWKEVKAIVRYQVEAVAKVNDVDTSRLNMDGIMGEISKSMVFILMQHQILNEQSTDILDLDQELIKMVRNAIDNATQDGGLTKSELRRRIGRNHIKYITQIDEILAYLIETGKYTQDKGRLIAITGDYTTMVPHHRRGRPGANDGKTIVRAVEGKLTDYVPTPKKG